MKNGLIRTLTLLLFITLIAGFVTCKSSQGKKKTVKQVDKDVNNENGENSIDSSETIKLLPSSKVLIMDDGIQLNQGKEKVEEADSTSERQMIWSSKSGIVLDVEDLELLKKDSLKNDEEK